MPLVSSCCVHTLEQTLATGTALVSGRLKPSGGADAQRAHTQVVPVPGEGSKGCVDGSLGPAAAVHSVARFGLPWWGQSNEACLGAEQVDRQQGEFLVFGGGSSHLSLRR